MGHTSLYAWHHKVEINGQGQVHAMSRVEGIMISTESELPENGFFNQNNVFHMPESSACFAHALPWFSGARTFAPQAAVLARCWFVFKGCAWRIGRDNSGQTLSLNQDFPEYVGNAG